MKNILKVFIVLSMFVIAMCPIKKAYASSTTVKKQTLYSKNGVKIRVLGLQKCSNGYNVKFAVYNNSKDTVNVDVSAYSVNNMDGDNPGWDEGSVYDLLAGNNALFKLNISNSFMKNNYIKTIKKISLVMLLNHDDEKDIVLQKTIRTNKDDKKYKKIKSKKIYSDKNMEVSYIKKDGNNVYFLVKNKYGKYMDITFDSCCVNGWSYDYTKYASNSLFDIHMLKDSYCVAKFNVGNSFMKNYDMEKIKKIQFIITGESDIRNLVIPTSLKYAEIKTGIIKYSNK